ncbi:hypothetical protein [Sphingomonas sp. ID0503]|uniref:hypothetical protein n=1 Tax=Sphingomonas sp. ID0503 TaxID=3399691 RepID=UPI003AFA4679
MAVSWPVASFAIRLTCFPTASPGPVIYEPGPALILAVAIGAGIAITDTGKHRLGILAPLALFALVAGTVSLAIEFSAVIHGQWF